MKQQVEHREGWLPVDDGRYRVFYDLVGSAENTLVVLHGGPGIGHSYLRRLSELAGEGLQVLFYDQLGGGRSDAPEDGYEWTVARFVDELEAVRTQLELGRVRLFGQSWGGCLALQYSLDHPESVASLVLSNTASSIPFAYSEMHRLRRELGPVAFARMLKHEADSTLDDPEYTELVTELYIRHLRRATPWSRERSLREWEELAPSIGLDELGPAYHAMWGPHEFLCTGVVLEWDVTERLGEISAPALIVCGYYDEATVETHRILADRLPDNEFVIFGNSSHLTVWEKEADAYLALIRNFLERKSMR